MSKPFFGATKAAAFFIFVHLIAIAGSFQLITTPDPSVATVAVGGGDSVMPLLSSDGRYILFASTANNLVLTTNGTRLRGSFPARFNVFLRDRTNATTSLVSVNLSGNGGNGDSVPVDISTNGQFVLFESSASNLVQNDTNGLGDVFVRDLVNRTNIFVSRNPYDRGSFANGVSRNACMTPDGRYVAFVSAASNLVGVDTNGIADIFVHDLQLGTTILASAGAQSTNSSFPLSSSEAPDISADGRYVAFYSTATNLAPGGGPAGEIYVRDLVSEATLWASANAQALLSFAFGPTNGVCYNHALSADGKFVAFEISSGRLSPGVILRFDVLNGSTEIVHTNAVSAMGNYEEIHTLDISSDGRFIAFLATNNSPSVLVWDAQTGTTTLASAGITNCEMPAIDATSRFVSFFGNSGLYVYDLQTNGITRVDVDANGVAAGALATSNPRAGSDGRFVAFQSADGQIVSSDNNKSFDVFLRDLQSNTTELISPAHPSLMSGTPNGPSMLSTKSVSGTGRFVTFVSEADNLVANDTNGLPDLFVRDLFTGTNYLVNFGLNGSGAQAISTEAVISDDGRYVAFTSTATNLVSIDTTKTSDVYVCDWQTSTLVLGSVTADGTAPGNNQSYSPLIGANGRYLAFRSKATNLTAGSFIGAENLFLRDLQNSTTIALTRGGVSDAAMTPDGRFIVFGGILTSGSLTNLYVWDTQASARIYTNANTFQFAAVAISADGNRLAYATSVSSGSLYMIDRPSRTTRTVALGSIRRGFRLSADGQFVAYHQAQNVYLYNFEAQITTLVSRAYNFSGAANGASKSPDISADGRYVAYHSTATDILAGGSTNDWPTVFLYDRTKNTNSLLITDYSGTSRGNNRSMAAVFSGDGRTLVFPSWASDLYASDFNHSSDIFAFAFLYLTIDRGNPSEGALVSWPAAPGQTYQVQYKNNLDDPDWTNLAGAIAVQGNTAFIQDTSPAAQYRFYRVLAF